MFKKITLQAFITDEYSRFKLIKGNRPRKADRATRIMKSIRKHGLKFSPVTVISAGEGKYLLVDGQSRHGAAQELKEPVMAVVVPKNQAPKSKQEMVELARVLSSELTKWSPEDHYRSGISFGYPVYLEYQKLVEEIGYNHSAVLAMLANGNACTAPLKDEAQLKLLLTKKNIQKAKNLKSFFLEVEEYFGKSLRARTVAAFAKVLGAYPKFDIVRFLRNVEAKSVKLLDRGTNRDTIHAIEEIYNHNQRQPNHVYFHANRSRVTAATVSKK